MGLVLMLLSGERAGDRVVVDRLPFRMGRGPENDLDLTEFDHVSTAHGEPELEATLQAADRAFASLAS